MNSRDLNRAVARATGESVREIAERGFVLLTCGPVELEPTGADGDELEHDRFGLPSAHRGEQAIAS